MKILKILSLADWLLLLGIVLTVAGAIDNQCDLFAPCPIQPTINLLATGAFCSVASCLWRIYVVVKRP